MSRYFNREVIRYVIAGMLNTAITYLSYILMLLFVPYSIAYLISYLLGILFSFFINSKMVFQTKMTLWKLIQYPLVYVAQFLLGLFLLYLFIDKLSMNNKIAPLIVTIVSLPVTYFVSKFILSGKLGHLLLKWIRKST
ncbi:GtrA family protein [Paenibacillus sp. NPDC058071]|uniref:GtrA family protein n=1 Tax=Paenibacillus sp. NPDC058071 TaxID=3346326 RepID=UPI0036DB054B